MGFVLMTADEAVRLRGKKVKVLVCTDEAAINEFCATEFEDCTDVIREAERIHYLFSDYVELLQVRSFQNPKRIVTTILFPPKA